MVLKNAGKKDNSLLKYIVLCLLFALFSICVVLVSGRAFEYKTYKNDVSESYVLVPNEKLTQTLDLPSEDVTGLSIGFMSYGRINSGTVTVTLCEDGTPVIRQSVEASYIADNSYHDFRFGKTVHAKSGRQYSIEINYDSSDSENTLAVITSGSGNNLKSSGAVIADRTLCYQLILVNGRLRTAAVIVFLLLCLAGVLLAIKKSGIDSISIPKIVLGTIAAILVVEFVSADLLSNTRLDVLSDVSQETGKSSAVEPGSSEEYSFKVSFSPVTRLSFALLQGDFDSIDVEIVNADTGYKYTERHLKSDEIVQDYFTGKNAFMITSDSCGVKNYPIGNYKVKITNTSKSVPLVIEMTESVTGVEEIYNIQSKYTWTSRIMACIMLAVASVYLYLLFGFTRKNPVKAENLFLLTAIPLGAIYFGLFQPWSVSDTTAHFEAIYRISNTLLGFNDNNGWMIRTVDNTFFDNVWRIAPSYPCTQSMQAIFDNFAAGNGSGTNLIVFADPMEQMEYYTIISYFPMVIGFAIARLIGLGPVPMLYLGRLFMWAFFVFVCYHSIKITPVGKMVIAAVCLLPMSLTMSNSISYDAMVIVATIFFTASVLRLRENYSLRNLIEACLAGILIGGVKGGGYLILLVLVFILWNKKDRERSIKTILLIVAASLFAFVIFNMLVPRVKLYQFGTEGSDKLSTMWGIKHPVEYFNMFVTAYLDYADDLIINMGGTVLSWEEFTIQNIAVVVLMVTAFIASVFEKDETALNKRDRIVFGLVILMSVCCTPVMLLSWTDAGSARIEGLQGRYYLPVLPLILMLMSKYKLKNAAADIKSENSSAILLECQRVFAVVSVLCVYYLMRLYLTR